MPLLDELEAEVPNFSEVIREIKRRLVLVLETNDPLDLDPILLFGPPGIGKKPILVEKSPSYSVQVFDLSR
jgi:ATP-dependent Lon protease